MWWIVILTAALPMMGADSKPVESIEGPIVSVEDANLQNLIRQFRNVNYDDLFRQRQMFYKSPFVSGRYSLFIL